jgi:hypothetical protein
MSAKELADFKEAAHAVLREGGMMVIPKYVERVFHEGNIEDMRKAVDLIMRVTGAEADKKADPNAGLPVFNFTFTGIGGVQATIVAEPAAPALPIPEESLEILDVVATTVKATPLPAPSPEPEALDDMVRALDDLLGI